MVSSIHTYICSKFQIVHPTKSKQKGRTRRRVDSNASFRDLKQICKMRKKKVRRRRRRRRLEEEDLKKKKKKTRRRRRRRLEEEDV